MLQCLLQQLCENNQWQYHDLIVKPGHYNTSNVVFIVLSKIAYQKDIAIKILYIRRKVVILPQQQLYYFYQSLASICLKMHTFKLNANELLLLSVSLQISILLHYV